MEKILIKKSGTASHEVDPQKGFTIICPNELPVPGGTEIADELNRQAQFTKYRTLSKDVHPRNAIWLANKVIPQLTPLNLDGELNVDVAWNPHCMSGTVGAELIPGLPKITEYDFVVFKGIEPNLHPYSGVYHDLEKKISTGLIEFYRQNDISTVIVGGLALNNEETPLCVGETIMDLWKTGFKIILNLGSTRWLGSDGGKDNFIERLKTEFNVILIESVDELDII